ncbi:TetR/AcrR family transcriptional regulator [Mycolicibacterium goodii]|uniref:TetR/AcrR family transcriptional regulator n=1 Tax=Mycolicibacterium goodii TaxID=134601 RepID=UPI00093A0BA6|nr:TetR/AcrR family transcriptional regulator C-terminal domain-containing protein [Mycolicibacterium goodii]MBU8829635.1 TetR/AcrR family transcriptional regulator [Mycolicibacterium goodii]OKH62549.1 transcriptional regulator [Mycobacterium sp. SWH-M5]PJK21517.1 TetR family transcriptional regulator [Mycolicibacterium goodii]
MPRQRSLSRHQIAAAALEVVDVDGLAALSMRTVARRLGTGTMSLYRYVADRDELEAMVVDLVLETVDLALPDRSARHRLFVLAERVRHATAQHPAVVPLVLAHRHHAPASLRWGETVLGVLAEAGHTGKRRVYAFRALLAYVFGALEVEHYSALSGPGTQALAELPADEFPHLSETASVARRITADDEFRRGLEIVLRGLAI